VRFIDAFVGHIDILKLGFAIKTLKTEGRPVSTESVSKIYLYGYLNGIRVGGIWKGMFETLKCNAFRGHSSQLPQYYRF
jgi:hypothetical protein